MRRAPRPRWPARRRTTATTSPRGADRATGSCSLRLGRVTGDLATAGRRLRRGPRRWSPGPVPSSRRRTEYRAVALGNLGTGLLWSGDLDEAEQRLRDGHGRRRGHAAGGRPDQHVGPPRHSSPPRRGGCTRPSATGHEAVDLVDARGWAPLPQASAAYLALAMVNLRWNALDEALRCSSRGRDDTGLRPRPRCARSPSRWRGCTPRRADAPLPATSCAALRQRARRLGAAGLPRAGWGASPRRRSTSRRRTARRGAARLRRLEAAPAAPARRRSSAWPGRCWRAVSRTRPTRVLPRLRDGERTHDCRVDVWVLSALVADRLREDNRALDAMQRAVELARRQGVRRPFLTLAPEHVRRLLGHLEQWTPVRETSCASWSAT